MIVDKEQVPDTFDICYTDCDLIKYRSAFAAEKTYWNLYDSEGNLVDHFDSAKSADSHLEELSEFLMVDTEGYYREPEKVIGEEQQAIKACDLILSHIKKKCPAKEYKLYLTGNDTYRPGIATLYKYKGNRDKMEKPRWIESVTKHLIEVHGAKTVNYIETDDAITVGLTAANKKGKLAVAANLDKDIYQCEGWGYDWDKDQFHYTDYWEGLVWQYVQCLAGDQVDNYKGIPRVGKVKAQKILKDCTTERELYEAAVKAYKDYFGDEYEYTSWDGRKMKKTYHELFMENMNLCYMQRVKDKFYEVPAKED